MTLIALVENCCRKEFSLQRLFDENNFDGKIDVSINRMGPGYKIGLGLGFGLSERKGKGDVESLVFGQLDDLGHLDGHFRSFV